MTSFLRCSRASLVCLALSGLSENLPADDAAEIGEILGRAKRAVEDVLGVHLDPPAAPFEIRAA
jgi:hypothetical protein